MGAARSADRHEQVEQPGQEDGRGGQPPDPPHPHPVGGHRGRGRPRGAPGPRGHHGRVEVGRRLVALHHVVAGGDPLERRRAGQVGVGQQEPDVQVGAGLELDPARLAVVEEDRREAQAARGARGPARWCPPGQAKKPVPRWVSSARSPPPVTSPVAPSATRARASSRASRLAHRRGRRRGRPARRPTSAAARGPAGCPPRGRFHTRREARVTTTANTSSRHDHHRQGEQQAGGPRGAVGAVQGASGPRGPADQVVDGRGRRRSSG